MDYPVKRAEEWAKLAGPSMAQRLASLCREACYRRRARRKARRTTRPTLDLVSASKQPGRGSDIVLISVCRNAEKYLPSLLGHYRRLGVHRFAFVDDASTDATSAILRQADDVDLFVSDINYRQAGGGMLWRDMLIDHYGRGRWYVYVDTDEYLVYPGCEKRPLQEFIGDLQRHGLKRAHAAMIDIYPDGSLGSHRVAPADAPPTETSPLYDGSGYTIGNEKFGTAVRGGPRLRLYGTQMRMSKFPVIYADGATQFAGGSVHGPLPLARNFAAVHAVLLHHKFPTGAVEDFRAIAALGAHTGNAVFYKQIISDPGFNEETDFRYAHSHRYAGAQQLVDQGFIQDLRRNPDRGTLKT